MKFQRPHGGSVSSPAARRVFLMMTIGSAIVFGFTYKYGSDDTESESSTRRSNEADVSTPEEPLLGHHRLHLPPAWGQFQYNELLSNALLTTPILMVATTQDEKMLRRSIENVLRATSGTGMNLILSLQKPSQRTLRLLSQYPLKIHEGEEDPEEKEEDGAFNPVSSILHRFRKVVSKVAGHEDVCPRDPTLPSFNVLNTARNSTHTSTYHLTLEEISATTQGVPFEDHPFNLLHRKATKNSLERDANGLQLPDQRSDRSHCKKARILKDAMNFALKTYPTLEHLILLESGYGLAKNFVRYFEETLVALKEDPSLYCISAHNPLANARTVGDPSKVYRVDHFVSRGTLIPKRVVEEIARDFVVFEDTGRELEGSALDILGTWLSWWSRRRRRGCIIPNVPRICHLRGRPAHVSATRIIHYLYSQDLYHQITSAKTLGVEEKDCRKKSFFPENMNSSESYSISVKMENYDDDFTFHHVMKCFGLDLPRPVGYFEGIFQLSFQNTSLMIMAVPYSRFSPALKDPNALILADVGDKQRKIGRMQYLKHRNHNFTFSNLPVVRITA
ncbi:protein O-linked-mannose beta-1,2-N-acetylglucosaminyltransferase 1-like [Macrobrachium nipponense]|uniref:protein O-linked-mannose beta-1,2-N-acetylglucosaminyltransferase 1-like n=1 Tax=Macrobrachium nipponense TaxID=159736 RepID=UPI0030C856F9